MKSRKYPKAFEKYWSRAGGFAKYFYDSSLKDEIKHQSYLSWQAGRNYQRRTYG